MTVEIKSVTSPQFVIKRPSYDYAPSVMKDTDGMYKAWWCAGRAGDFIGYAESNDFRSGFEVIESKFFPNRSHGKPDAKISFLAFDGLHACDPSVLKIADKYYLYYGGLANHKVSQTIKDKEIRLTDYPQANSVATTYIGVAESRDGVNWKRQNNGNPIIKPQADPTNIESYASYSSVYGAGQPSVVYLDNQYYLAYHDSTGEASNSVNGAGIYVLSSVDPLFQKNVKELRCQGDERRAIAAGSCDRTYWKPLAAEEKPSTKYAIAEAFSPAIAYSDSFESFVLATHHQQGKSRLNFFNSQFKLITEELTLTEGLKIPGGNWRDGPGLLADTQGHLISKKKSLFACNSTNVDIFSGSSATKDLRTWDIAHWSAVLNDCTSPITKISSSIVLVIIIIFLFLLVRSRMSKMS